MSDPDSTDFSNDQDPSEDYRVKFKLHDKNNTRFQNERLEMSAAHHNLDVQAVIRELRESDEANGNKFNRTETMSDLMRDGCRLRVLKFPEDATPGMFYIFNNSLSNQEAKMAEQGKAEEAGLIPLLSQYHKVKLKGKTMAMRYCSKQLTEQNIIDIYDSISAVMDDIFDDYLLRQIIDAHKVEREKAKNK
jgi:hypothetical protein